MLHYFISTYVAVHFSTYSAQLYPSYQAQLRHHPHDPWLPLPPLCRVGAPHPEPDIQVLNARLRQMHMQDAILTAQAPFPNYSAHHMCSCVHVKFKRLVAPLSTGTSGECYQPFLWKL